MKLDRWKTVVLSLIGISLLIYIFSPNFIRLARVYKQLQVLEEEINRLQVQNEKVQSDIYALKHDPHYVEKVAREELGMSKSDEIIYKFEETPEGSSKNSSK